MIIVINLTTKSHAIVEDNSCRSAAPTPSNTQDRQLRMANEHQQTRISAVGLATELSELRDALSKVRHLGDRFHVWGWTHFSSSICSISLHLQDTDCFEQVDFVVRSSRCLRSEFGRLTLSHFMVNQFKRVAKKVAKSPCQILSSMDSQFAKWTCCTRICLCQACFQKGS